MRHHTSQNPTPASLIRMSVVSDLNMRSRLVTPTVGLSARWCSRQLAQPAQWHRSFLQRQAGKAESLEPGPTLVEMVMTGFGLIG